MSNKGGGSSSSRYPIKHVFTGIVIGVIIASSWETLMTAPSLTDIESHVQDINILDEDFIADDQTPSIPDKDPIVDRHPIYPIPDSDLRKTIREWGCNRTDTPLIFVHLGKAGGGSVRIRLAAASLNFTKEDDWTRIDGSYFPVSETEKAYFCNSCFFQRRPSNEKTYELTVWCHATTPIGMAVACPEGHVKQVPARKWGKQACQVDSPTCHMVYAGHNLIGSEFTWLPHKYLSNWWESLERPSPPIPWHRVNPQNIWCDARNIPRPNVNSEHKKLHGDCGIPLAREVDHLASLAVSNHPFGLVDTWAPIYASLPVLRVTVMREPFTWLMSKFFWHSHQLTQTCDDIVNATKAAFKFKKNRTDLNWETVDMPRRQDFKEDGQAGWVRIFCLTYIFYYCGEECSVRYAAGRANLEELERQAEENIRHSFAVVGVLEDMDDFYSMINARVKYMDTTLNVGVEKGEGHGTAKKGEAARCKQVYKNPQFQSRLLRASPELRVVQRLYQVGKKVKDFQMKELEQCSPSSFPSKEEDR